MLPVVRFGASGKRLYAQDALKEMLTGNSTPEPTKQNIAYARVSSSHQKEDLDRQIQDLRTNFPTHRIISDIASGINFKRRGMQTILELALSGNLGEVVVMHRDRLARFGVELFETIFTKTGAKLVVFGGDQKNAPSELAEDLLAITTVFVARHNGTRSAVNRKRRKTERENATGNSSQNTRVSVTRAEENAGEMDGDLEVDVQPVCTLSEDQGESRIEEGSTRASPQQRECGESLSVGSGDALRRARRGDERRAKGGKVKFRSKEEALRSKVSVTEGRVTIPCGPVEALGEEAGGVLGGVW